MGDVDVWKHYGGGWHTNVDWRPIFEYLYSLELGNPLGFRGSACVEVMTTLHGSAPSFRRRAKDCVPPEGLPSYMRVHLWAFKARSMDTVDLGSASWISVRGRLIKSVRPVGSDRYGLTGGYS
ncbi:hypothetical protein CK203_046858 [Vitis vinifera]|uniref:Uncharacterized protein n=1 Tax=Vitis vinifera TaxID=29760 RepID=A0A438HYB1_VITVI|nr:hypothetical protein CK203_046858 [Vitis vinifera]